MGVSLRKINSAYTGDCIKVRRDDNTLQDIGFLANGELDVAALTTFTGAGSGFVHTWYDQSGSSNDVTTENDAAQPRIVNSGVYDAAVKFTASAHNLKFLDVVDEHTLFYVVETTDTHGLHFQSDVAGGNFFMLAQPSSASNAYSAAVGTITYWVDGVVTSWVSRNDVSVGLADGVQKLVTLAGIDVSNTIWDPMYLGNYAGFPISPTFVSEIILYPSHLITADQEGVELDITTHYSL